LSPKESRVTQPIASSTPSYFGAAFFQQYNLILLGGSALFSLASASPLPVAVGAGLELLWLGVGSRLRPFRRWVKRRLDVRARLELDDSITIAMQSLDGVYTSRLVALERVLDEIRAFALQSADAGELAPTFAKLDAIRPGVLRICQLHQRLSRFLSDPAEASLEQEVARLDQAFTTERDLGVRFTLRQAIVLAQKRKQERDRLVGMRRAIELRLEMLDKSVAHLRSRSATLLSPPELGVEVDALSAQLASVAALEAEAVEASAAAQPSVDPQGVTRSRAVRSEWSS
jgi:hypothetical protein